MAKGKGKRKIGAGDVASNRYASLSLRADRAARVRDRAGGHRGQGAATSGAQLKDGYAAIREGELWLHSVHIPPYGPASRENHDPERPRKLLAAPPRARPHRRASGRARADAGADADLFLRPHAKVEIALARGKDLYDKRQTIREREQAGHGTRGARSPRSLRGTVAQ